MSRSTILPAYAGRAAAYDSGTAAFQGWRDELVALLPVRPGDTVLDVGCGSGLCFSGLLEKIGPDGMLIGVDEAPEMIALAQRRVDRAGWRNVVLLAEPIEHLSLDDRADAALFCAVHDVLLSPAALDNVFAQLRPGAWVVAGGGKWPPTWNLGLTAMVAALHAPYIRDFHGFDRPWELLETHLDQPIVTEVALGAGFRAIGRARAE